MPILQTTNDAMRWAGELGLATSPLFGSSRQRAGLTLSPAGDHYALLDGVRGSFIISSGEINEAEVRDNALVWAWSSNVHHHVTVTKDRVTVRRTGRSPLPEELFARSSVEDKLDTFFEYLTTDAARPSVSAVEHVVTMFRRHRVTMFPRQSDPDMEIGSFLYLMANLIENGRTREADATGQLEFLPSRISAESLISRYSLPARILELAALNADYERRFLEELSFNADLQRSLNLELTLRHAGGALFQEAHADLATEIQETVFGLATVERASLNLSKGAYYTPIGLARIVAEAAIRPHLHKSSLRILDPACGSGVFLCETLRALQRFEYSGTVDLHGTDISAAAVQMARFSLAFAKEDFPDRDIRFRVEERSFLDGFPAPSEPFDLILMNPPFRSWEMMDVVERQAVQIHLGEAYEGKPDLSIVFVIRAMAMLAEGGSLGCLLPVGVLGARYANKWRQALLKLGQIEFVAVLGDHYLFRHAMVNIASLILTKRGTPDAERPFVMLWASEKPQSGEAALRALRRRADHRVARRDTATSSQTRERGWNIYLVKQGSLAGRESWLPAPNSLGGAEESIRATTSSNVKSFFNVHQGIRTGGREVFILAGNDHGQLPPGERQYFRPVAESDSIINGQILSDKFVFYPPEEIGTEEELASLLPTYYARYLKPNAPMLSGRKKISLAHWWRLSWSRGWLKKAEPRIVSKMFATWNGFALDAEGSFAIVQGYAWVPIWGALGLRSSNAFDASSLTLLRLYMEVLNSEIFYLLAREYSTNVAGGQIDLAPKFINAVPLPDLGAMCSENSILSDALEKLASAPHTREAGFRLTNIERNRWAAAAYRISLEDLPVNFK